MDKQTGQGKSGGSFVKALGFLDATMIVAGSMIGSGIFLVSADMARLLGSPGLLLMAWAVTGLLTISAALSLGELASMMPQAGGQYVYIREAYGPLPGFLYGWTLFLVIQTGTIAAVSVAFARYLAVFFPAISPTDWIFSPLDISENYAISLSTQQAAAILMIAALTFINTLGIRAGKYIQNTFTITKTLSLLALIVLGIFIGKNSAAIADNFSSFWSVRNPSVITPDLGVFASVSAAGGAAGLLVALGLSQVGSLFSSDAWNNITFAAGEVKNPGRNIPLALFAGTSAVIGLYLLANVAYLFALPFSAIQNAPEDRVATAALQAMFGPPGAFLMAAGIVISTFGCNNGLILSGARVTYAMAGDGLFFKSTGRLNSRGVPAVSLVIQGVWAALLVLPRTRLRDATGALLRDSGKALYGNLYSNLLDYVIFAVLIFYIVTVGAVFLLRIRRPEIPRPYRATGYPLLPGIYIVCALILLALLAVYRTQTVWPGLAIVMSGVPVYFLWKRKMV